MVGEDAAAGGAGFFLDEAEIDEAAERGAESGESGFVAQQVAGAIDLEHGVALEQVVDARDRRRGGTEIGDATLVVLEQAKDARGCTGGLLGGGDHAFEEKDEPVLPDTVDADALKEFIVGGAVLFEVER